MHNSEILQDLNDAQQEAVMHGEGPAMVVAGPGSGKTLTIIRRLLYLIYERNVPADRILVITYTKEAALSMQQKFYEQKEQFDFKQSSHQGYVSFGTFHSFFYQIIKNIKNYSEFQLISPQEKHNLAKNILKETRENVTDYSIKRFLEQVSFFKNTGKHKGEEDIEELFVKYQQAMQRYKRMDFDDMLFLCKKEFLKDEILLNTYRERYKYILIDEYQDINSIQYELMYLLTIHNPNIFVVGDDDQAIYGFRGSDTECFQKFVRDYKNTHIIHLNINYRCTADIVKASRNIISKNRQRLEKNIISGVSEQKSNIVVTENETPREMYQRIVEKLQNTEISILNKSAILFRTNASLQSFANILAGKQVPFVVREKIQSFYEHFIVCDILDFFKAAHGCKDRSIYIRICNKMNNLPGRELFFEERVDLELVKKRLENGIYNQEYGVEQIFILEKHMERLAKMRPELGISYILHAMNYEKYLLSKVGNLNTLPEEWREILGLLKEDAERYEDFKSWMKDIQNSNELLERHKIDKKSDAKGIHLMTMHGAKGLEYDKIYMLHLNDGIIPKLRRGERIKEEHLEEERRLFYVAVTRAKYSLELYYVTGTKENPRIKSRFLNDIFND